MNTTAKMHCIHMKLGKLDRAALMKPVENEQMGHCLSLNSKDEQAWKHS